MLSRRGVLAGGVYEGAVRAWVLGWDVVMMA